MIKLCNFQLTTAKCFGPLTSGTDGALSSFLCEHSNNIHVSMLRIGKHVAIKYCDIVNVRSKIIVIIPLIMKLNKKMLSQSNN